MDVSLLTPEVESALAFQGIAVDVSVGLLDAPGARGYVDAVVGTDRVEELKTPDDAVRVARSSALVVLVVGSKSATQVLSALGSDASSVVATIVVGPDGPSAATLRAMGAMAVLVEPSESKLRPLLLRGLEFRALRALELAHRCESRRIRRREMEILGHPPETMTDDLNTVQPPPLPVGPVSMYNLEAASELFERAYIDRVQHLSESGREAAQHLDVSAATLARRVRREVGSGGSNGS